MDYTRLDYEHRRHHERFARFVEREGVTCQECGGSGGYTEIIMDGMGPFYECGWCEGTGKMTKRGRGWWLTCQKIAKSEASTAERKRSCEAMARR